jgi:cobalt/nickel transport system permease protein
MHIPDGYLSPQTYLPFYGVMIPMWAIASRRLKQEVGTRRLPLVALGAAFSFIIMMFNIPMPGGAGGHGVGSVILAILLGPWAACIAVSSAIVIQSLFFGDGGITAIATNCFNMAVVMPFSGYFIYRLLAGSSPENTARQTFAAAIAGYGAICLTALYTAIEYGIQPIIATGPSGNPLYAPFPLKITIPALLFQHLLFFGIVEGLLTALVVRYVTRTRQSQSPPTTDRLQFLISRGWQTLALLIFLSPLGILIPLASGTKGSWGEWNIAEVHQMTGTIPSGMEKLADIWHAPFNHYAVPGSAGNVSTLAFAYVAAAILGTLLTLVMVHLATKTWRARSPE